MDGPDFICVGMQKAGTAWLFDQLKLHTDFWAPLIKGTYYLHHAVTKQSEARDLLRIMDHPDRLGKRVADLRPVEVHDHAFLQLLDSYVGKARNFQHYAALFRFGGARISGDITPGYSDLDEETIAQIAAHFPGVRVVLLIRDPIERVWSQISMKHRQGTFKPAILEKDSVLRSFLDSSEDIKKFSYPTEIVKRWQRAAPNIRLRHFFFDDIATDPGGARRQIISFLGGDPDKPSGDISPGLNRKSRYRKLEMTDRVRGVIVDHFADELRACSAMFGQHAETWKSRYLVGQGAMSA
ncbi:MAG: sulfotransferase [Rhizomicrobium sp.]